MPRATRFVFLALIALAAAIATISVVLLLQGTDQQQQPRASVGGAFSMVDENGKAVTEADFKGRNTLMFFGFINCPDVCPMTLQRIAEALDVAPELKTKVTPILISVDPERDTPALMKEYVGHFGPEFRGLTGTRQQVEAMLKAYKVYAKKVELKDSALGYTMDHSSLVFLFGPQGELITTFDPNLEPEALAAMLKERVR